MTRRTPGRTAGYDNRRPIRSPFIPLRNTPITGWNKPDRYTSRLTAQRARYHHEIRARSVVLAPLRQCDLAPALLRSGCAWQVVLAPSGGWFWVCAWLTTSFGPILAGGMPGMGAAGVGGCIVGRVRRPLVLSRVE